MPSPKTDITKVSEEGQIKGFARVAVTKIDHRQDCVFVKKFIRLNTESLNLELFDSGEPDSEEDMEPDELIELKDKLVKVDTSMQNKLISDYEVEFGSTSDEIELPDDGFEHPMALIFEDGEMIIMWTDSKEIFEQWAAILQKIIAQVPDQDHRLNDYFLVRSSENHFTMTLYKCMQRIVTKAQLLE